MNKKNTTFTLTVKLPKRLSLVLKYLRENWGAPFVVGFQVLLLFCAWLLIQGYASLANEVAIHTFYLLVIGVVLQLVSYLKYGKGSDVDE